MRHTLLIAALSPLALAGCIFIPLPGPAPWDRPQPACIPDMSLVGQPASVIASSTFPQGTRIFTTGDALTADFSPTRLNIEIGQDGVIKAVTCG